MREAPKMLWLHAQKYKHAQSWLLLPFIGVLLAAPGSSWQRIHILLAMLCRILPGRACILAFSATQVPLGEPGGGQQEEDQGSQEEPGDWEPGVQEPYGDGGHAGARGSGGSQGVRREPGCQGLQGEPKNTFKFLRGPLIGLPLAPLGLPLSSS